MRFGIRIRPRPAVRLPSRKVRREPGIKILLSLTRHQSTARTPSEPTSRGRFDHWAKPSRDAPSPACRNPLAPRVRGRIAGQCILRLHASARLMARWRRTLTRRAWLKGRLLGNKIERRPVWNGCHRLSRGDMVLTLSLSDGQLSPQQVRWVGHRRNMAGEQDHENGWSCSHAF